MAVAKQRNRSLDTVKIGIGLEEPDTDFAMLAKSFGIYGEGPIEDPDQVGPALKRAIKVVKEERRMALVNTVTQPR
jgi:thiamine pyrophosphate-dependent acetolactate synthase large subunit-like protein